MFIDVTSSRQTTMRPGEENKEEEVKQKEEEEQEGHDQGCLPNSFQPDSLIF